jgi:hypothetical protein
MGKRVAYLFCVGFSLCTITKSVHAQSLLFESFEISIPQSDTSLFLDTWLDPHSILIQTLPDSNAVESWRYDRESGFIHIPKIDSLLISRQKALTIYYGRIPTSLRRVYQQNIPFDYSPEASDQDSINKEITMPDNRVSSDIEQSGSLSRGIIVGSNQDFALESGLQFQLSGQLTDDITLDAILTDQSIPFQPDGTTQSIREFDRVLIRLSSEQAQLEMGDVDVQFANTTFGQLNRRLQGASGRYSGGGNQTKFAVSSVRGTFSSQQFEGIEGVRGPYRLTGRNNQPFVIILAGTERVYINGQLVDRGEENEYIIDYGLGEIYFTDQVFIKDETRIFVEYEYVDQEFSRTLVAAEGSQKLWDDRFELGVSVIRMADGNDLLSQQSLSANDIDVLESVGDNIQNAIVSGIVDNPDDDVFNIRYALVDTLFQGQNYQIFKNIPGSNNNMLAVRFSNVGQGNGAYIRVGNTLNGLLYEWRGPGQGSYEPFRNLPAPEKHQMVSFTGSHKISNNLEWYGEMAFSDLDRNRFSALDDDDNADVALIGGFNAKALEVGATLIDVEYQHRQSGSKFEAFERTREVEFDRRWNIDQTEVNGEQLDEMKISAEIYDHTEINVGAGRLSLPELQSWRQSAGFNTEVLKSTNVRYQQEFARTRFDVSGAEDSWLKQQSSVTTKLTNRLFGVVNFEQEDKRNRSNTRALENNSFRFFEVAPGMEYRLETAILSAGLAYREGDIAKDGAFVDEYSAIEQQYGLEWELGNIFSTVNNVRFRNKRFSEALIQQCVGNSNALLINSENQLETEQLNVRSRYSVSTQRQSLVQESYFEVGPELGQYVWIDGNNNGIEEIDEFFPELSPNEGTYILQFLPSDELVPATELRFINGLEWMPFKANQSTSEEHNVLHTLELESRFDVLENTTNPNEREVYMMKLETFRNDSLTIQGRLNWTQRIQINPTKRWESSMYVSNSRSLNRRTSEVVRSFDSNITFENDIALKNNQAVSLSLSTSTKQNESDALDQRTFNIRSWQIEPAYRYRYSRSFQMGVRLGYSSKLNEDESGTNTRARLYRSVIISRAYLFDKIQFGSNVEFRNTSLSGQTNTFANFELTEGTGSGNHLIWSMNASYLVSNLVRITFNYDGRTVALRPDIHTIKLVVSAIF